MGTDTAASRSLRTSKPVGTLPQGWNSPGTIKNPMSPESALKDFGGRHQSETAQAGTLPQAEAEDSCHGGVQSPSEPSGRGRFLPTTPSPPAQGYKRDELRHMRLRDLWGMSVRGRMAGP